MPIKCSGQCCRNPYGVCSHRRQCEHHAPERREAYQAARTAAQAVATRTSGGRYRWRASA